MYALRERQQHVTQADFEFTVAKVEEEPRGQSVRQQAFLVVLAYILYLSISSF